MAADANTDRGPLTQTSDASKVYRETSDLSGIYRETSAALGTGALPLPADPATSGAGRTDPARTPPMRPDDREAAPDGGTVAAVRIELPGGCYWQRFPSASSGHLYELMMPDGSFVDANTSTEADARAFAAALWSATPPAAGTAAPQPPAAPGAGVDAADGRLDRMARVAAWHNEHWPDGLVSGNLYVAVKLPGEGTGWRYDPIDWTVDDVQHFPAALRAGSGTAAAAPTVEAMAAIKRLRDRFQAMVDASVSEPLCSTDSIGTLQFAVGAVDDEIWALSHLATPEPAPADPAPSPLAGAVRDGEVDAALAAFRSQPHPTSMSSTVEMRATLEAAAEYRAALAADGGDEWRPIVLTDDQLRNRLFEVGKPSLREWCRVHGVNSAHASEFATGARGPGSDLLRAMDVERVWRPLPAPPRVEGR